MAIPPQLIMAAAQMIKNRKSNKDRIKEALAPATDVLKNTIAPLVGMGADAGMMYNLRAEDPSMRTGIATGAIGSAAKGFQSNGITGLLTGGIMGGLTGAIATGNAKEQKAEADKYTYLNQMYGSVVGADNNLQSALMYAEEGGEIVSAEGEVFVPIQTEAKRIGKKLVKEKFIFSDGKIADVNATKPHSEQKKDDVTDITVEGTYVMPVSTKLNKKDLDSLISYSTSNYSENGKNFAVEKVTLRDILGEKFEGSFAEATDIITKKYPVMDTDDDLDPIARITNNENIANRSKIIAHLMRLNEAKINKEPIEEVKLTPSMKAKKGGYIQKYVLGSTVVSNPPKKKKKDSEYLDLKDERKIRSTTGLPIDPNTDLLSGKYKKDTINDIIYYAKKHDVDPYTALAVGLQETGLGTSDPNIGHTIGDQDVERGENEIEDFVKVLKYKTSDYAKKQGISDDDEEKRLQAYNGYGNVNTETEEDYHGFKMRKIYGVPIPKEGINMKENPLYGRQIIDIRDNVIKKNKNINELIKTVQNSSKATTLSTETVGNKEIDRFIDFKSNIADTRIFEKKPIITSKIDFKNNKVKNTVEIFKAGGFIKKYVLGSTISGDPTKPKTALEKKKEKYDANKQKPVNQYTIRAYEPKSKAKQIYKKLVAPVSAMDNRSDTSYEDPSGLDVIAASKSSEKDLPKMDKGGFINQYVLKPKMNLKKGGYIRKMEEGGGVGDPPGKKYTNKKGNTIIVGDDKKFYWKNPDGSYKEAAPQIVDAFNKEIKTSNNPTVAANSWRLLGDSTPKSNNVKNGDYKVLEEFAHEYQQPWYQGVLERTLKSGRLSQSDVDNLRKNAEEKGYTRKDVNIDRLPTQNLDPINSMETMDILGAPVPRPNAPSPISTVSVTSNSGKNWSIGPLGEKNIDWNLTTPVDGFGDYVKSKIEEAKGISKGVGINPNYNAPDDNEVDPKYLKGTGVTTAKFTPKGSYYIPGENKNRYDKDEEGNWYVQKEDGKTWVPASSLPNSAEAIKKLNDQSKMSNGTQSNKPAASSSLVKPKTKSLTTNEPESKGTQVAMIGRMSNNEIVKNAENDLKEIESSYYRAYSDNELRKKLLNNFKGTSDDDINNSFNFINSEGDTSGDGSPELSAYYAKKLKEEKAKRDNKKLPKMAKGGYIRKMYSGGPIVPLLPHPGTGIWGIDETGMPPYYELPPLAPNATTGDPNLRKTSSIPPDDNEVDPKYLNPSQAKGLTPTDPTTSTPNTGDEEVLDMYRTKISERKGDAVRDAEEAKTGYKALSKRVGMRDLMQLGTGLVGIGLQDRTEKRAFKRPMYIDQKYRGLSPQQINQQAEASTGAGVEAIKQMMNGGGDRITSRLAPVLLDRIMTQQGQVRKAYVDQNTALERAKYGERGTIQQANLDEESRAQNAERDFNNKAISSSAQLINKYISSRSEGDIQGYKTEEGINRDLTDKLYKLDNNQMEVDMVGKEYEMQMSNVRQKINDLEGQLMDPKITLDEAARKSVEWNIAKNKEELRMLEERDKKQKIRNKINGQ